MLYRILTENKNREAVEDLVGQSFPGFTSYEGLGHWQGAKENSLIIEVDTDNHWLIRHLASDIKELNHQQAVMIQAIKTDVVMV